MIAIAQEVSSLGTCLTMVGKIKEGLVPLRGAQREEVSQVEAAQGQSAPANGVGGGMQGREAGS